MIDVVDLKTCILNELKQRNDAELVESWKQVQRDDKVSVLKNRQRLMGQLRNSVSYPLNHQTREGQVLPEHVQMAVLTELRNMFGTEVIESWRQKEIFSKTNQLAFHHQLMNEIRNNEKKIGEFETLKRRSLSFNESRNAVISDLKRRHSDVIPEWKEKKLAIDRKILASRNQLLQDISSPVRSVSSPMRASSGFISKRTKLMEEVRKLNPVEQWKQEIRNLKSSPIIAKKLVLDEIESDGLYKRLDLKQVELENPDKTARDSLLSEIRIESVLPQWKTPVVKQRSQALKMKNLLNCEILDKTTTLSPQFQERNIKHRELMRNIRENGDLGNLEAWKEKIRDQRADAIFGKHSISADPLKLVTPKKVVRKCGAEVRNALMNDLRKEPIEAWKEKRSLKKTKVLMAKSEVVREIDNLVYVHLKHPSTPVADKSKCMEELRKVTDSPLPAWIESKNKCKVDQLGNKVIMQEELKEFKNSTNLKSSKSVLEKRIDLLRDLRRERIPSWKEEERVEKVKVQVAKVMVNAEISDMRME